MSQPSPRHLVRSLRCVKFKCASALFLPPASFIQPCGPVVAKQPPTGQGLAARTEAWRLPAGGALLKTPNLIGLMAHSSARSTAWKSRIYLSRSQFHLCLALQPQLPQFSRTGEKLLLRCVIFCSCLWSVSFSFLAGFEKPLGALVLCIVLFKHTHQTPESQQSSKFLSKMTGFPMFGIVQTRPLLKGVVWLQRCGK